MQELRSDQPEEIEQTPELGIGYSKDGKSVVSKDDKSVVSKPQNEPQAPRLHGDVWSVVTGDFGSWSGSGSDEWTTAQFTLGADLRLRPTWIVGLLGSVARTWGDFSEGDWEGWTYGGGFYTSYWHQGWYVNAAFLGRYSTFDISRSDNTGSTNGIDLTGYGSTGYDFVKGNWKFGPWVSLQYDHLTIDGYRESGPSPLSYSSRDVDSLISRVGGRIEYNWRLGPITVQPRLELAWGHQWLGNNLSLQANWVDVPLAVPARVHGSLTDRNTIWGSIGAEAIISRHWSIFTSNSIEAGDHFINDQVDLGVRFKW